MSTEYKTVNLSEIAEGKKFQFRVSPYNLESLKESLRLEGQRVPILIRERKDGRFDLLAGHNRVAALRELKRPTAEAKVYKGISDDDAFRISLLDNIEREDLTPWDLVYAAAQLRGQGKSNAETGRLLKGVTNRTVQRYLVVARAPSDFKKALMQSEITIQQAYEGITRGIPLRELRKKGQSVRRLRQMSRTKKISNTSAIVRHGRSGDIDFRVNFRPGESNLDEIIAKTSEMLNEFIALRTESGRKL